MRKVLIDLQDLKTREEVHDCLAKQFDFPSDYGHNLDELYAQLTGIEEDTCIGIFELDRKKQKGELAAWIDRLNHVVKDAEAVNPHMCVIFSDQEANYWI